jgi:hypothetical protein
VNSERRNFQRGRLPGILSILTAPLVLALVLAPGRAQAASAPGITQQPQTQSLLLGTTATFTVTASGSTPLSYQWSFNSVSLTNNSHITGATSATLTVSNLVAADAGNYQVVVTNNHGSVTSLTATLTLRLNSSNVIRFVNQANPNPAAPYTSWISAATNIQDTVDAAVAGDRILVANGIYQSGARLVSGMSNRLAIPIPLTLESANGPNSTWIDGGGAIRCVYLADGSSLNGFTLTNGISSENGGGVRCDSTNAVLTNCVLAGNSTSQQGGGAYQGTLLNCSLVGNSAGGILLGYPAGAAANSSVLVNCLVAGNSTYDYGVGGGLFGCQASQCLITSNSAPNSLAGGASHSTLTDCLLVGNYAGSSGGGADSSTLNNCTVAGNTALNGPGGGVNSCTVNNCIVYYNAYTYATVFGTPDQTNCANSLVNYTCTTPLPTNGVGNIVTPPAFVDLANGNWRLQSNSPCINAGNNGYVTTSGDLDGNPRIVGSTTDMGSYEYQAPTIALIVQPLSQTRRLGRSVQFSVAAISPFPLTYQWYLNGAPVQDGATVSGSTTAALTVTNLQISDAGNYTVRLMNYAGSVFSAPATLTVNGPAPGVPFITSFNPGSGSIGTTVSISGLNFSTVATENAVWFGAVRATVVSASSSNLLVKVPSGATFVPITVTVAGLVGTANAPFLPTFPGNGMPIGTNLLAPRLNLPCGSGPSFPLIADLDGDGKPDLIVGNDNSHTISIFRNISTAGTLIFAPRVDLAPIPTICCIGNPTGITVADVDGDGKPDIVVCDWGNQRILVYPNVATQGVLDTNSFAAPVGFGVNGDLAYVHVADVDGDGRPDIVVATHALRTISILRNVGSAGNITSNSFVSGVALPVGTYVFDVAIVDLDGDGKMDLAAVNPSSTSITVFQNIGSPGMIDSNSFAPPLQIPSPTNCYTIIAADVDGDGRPDLIVGGNLFSLFPNQSSPGALTTNSFGPRVDFPGAGSVVGAGDLSGDGRPDLCALGGTLAVFQNLATPGFLTTNSLASPANFPAGSTAFGLSVGDLDGDGRPEVVSCDLGNGTAALFQNLAPYGGPPVILTQPASQAVPVNTTANFPSFVAGSAPLNFQWFYNGTNLSDGGHIGGLSTASLSISNLQVADAGTYYFLVTNSFGAATSAVATLTPIIVPPGFVQQPISQTNILGSNAVFTASISGSQPMSFQWWFNGAALTDNARISGSATTTLSIANLQTNDAGPYQLVVSNAANVVTSLVASLTILIPPMITAQPSSLAVILNSNATFSVAVQGTPPLSFQWYFKGISLSDSGHIVGSTTTNLMVLNVQPPDVGNYQMVITNVAGSATSSAAALSISTPLISSQPQSQSVLGGATVTLSAGVTGQQPLSYQWQYNGGPLSGATTNPLALPNVLVSQAGTYSLLVTNPFGTASSSNANLVVAPLAITQQPTNRVAWPGGAALFNVKVTGNGPFTYRWQHNGSDLGGIGTNSLLLTNIQSAQYGSYAVVVSNAYGSLASSNAVLYYSQVAVWGDSPYGETNLISGLTNIIAISAGPAGPADCIALRGDGSAIHWPETNHVAVTNLIALAGAGYQIVAMKADGTAVNWETADDIVVKIAGFTNLAAVAADYYGSLALMTNGTLVGSASVAGLSNVVASSQGYSHSLALRSDGTMTAWGGNSYGQLNVPVGLSNVVAIAAGYYHSLALRGDGTVVAWGRAFEGQTNIPAGLSNVVAIAAGGYHNLALKKDGTVVAWGMNTYGQTNVPGTLTNVIAVATGEYLSMALLGNGPPVTQASIINPTITSGRFTVTVPTQSGAVYVLQYKNSLSDSSWTSLPLVPGTGGLVQLTDQAATNSQRFYRILRW